MRLLDNPPLLVALLVVIALMVLAVRAVVRAVRRRRWRDEQLARIANSADPRQP